MDDNRLRRDLDSAIAYALMDDGIVKELRAQRIPASEVARAVRNSPEVIARFRATRDWSRQLTSVELDASRWELRLSPAAGPLVALAIVVVYVILLLRSLPLMPLWLDMFALVGMAATVVLASALSAGAVRVVWQAMRRARYRWLSDAADRIILPELRQYLAEHRKPIYGTKLTVTRTYLDDDREAPTVVTSAGEQLRRILSRPAAGAIAIAGPRGVGKTTTIHAIADGMFSDPYEMPPLPVIAAAPSRYEARDFVLHLHTILCRQVIEKTSALLFLPEVPRHTIRRFFRWPVVTVLLVVSLLGVAAALWTGPPDVIGQSLDQRFLFTLGTVTVWRAQAALVIVDVSVLIALASVLATVRAVAWAAWRLFWRGWRMRQYPRLPLLRTMAFDQLRRIRFLQTYTSGWSGKIGLPAGAEAGWNASVQRAEQNLTHPEVVASFREFATLSAATLTRADACGRLMIAIDELDKIAEPAQAQELVNDIKGIFGIPDCLFLVSVSEDALAAFEGRGIPVRDAFDSAFTQMVRMDHFTLAESRRWLSRRLIGVPEQFTYLLHCLSGGLPRELRRVTIELVDIIDEDERGDLSHVTGVLLDRELDRKAHSFAAAARRYEDTVELSSYLADLLSIPTSRTPAALADLASRLKPPSATELGRVRWQSACFLLFCATVLEIFHNKLTSRASAHDSSPWRWPGLSYPLTHRSRGTWWSPRAPVVSRLSQHLTPAPSHRESRSRPPRVSRSDPPSYVFEHTSVGGHENATRRGRTRDSRGPEARLALVRRVPMGV